LSPRRLAELRDPAIEVIGRRQVMHARDGRHRVRREREI